MEQKCLLRSNYLSSKQKKRELEAETGDKTSPDGTDSYAIVFKKSSLEEYTSRSSINRTLQKTKGNWSGGYGS